MKKFTVYLFILFVVTGFAVSASADNLHPPQWVGDPNSTHLEILWDPVESDYSLDFSWVEVDYPLYSEPARYGWEPELGGFSIVIPNFVDSLPVKHMRIQIAYLGENKPNIEFVYAPGEHVYGQKIDDYTQEGYFYEDYDIIPNPYVEEMFISMTPVLYGEPIITQIVIDTISTTPIPEPTTMLLLGSGIAGLAGFRRRPPQSGCRCWSFGKRRSGRRESRRV